MPVSAARWIARALIAGSVVLPLAIAAPSNAAQPSAQKTTFTAEVWADNWFALYVNGKKVGEDSVPITTERSFNSERITFKANYPLTIGIVGKDFTENASGLEYIGSPRQQIGDGGLIAQITDNTSRSVVAATDGSWKALVINRAPLNPSCVTSRNPLADCKSKTVKVPRKWSTAKASRKGWTNATVYSPQQVGVKEGYNDVSWDRRAKLIWGPDLKLDNEILFTTTVKSAR